MQPTPRHIFLAVSPGFEDGGKALLRALRAAGYRAMIQSEPCELCRSWAARIVDFGKTLCTAVGGDWLEVIRNGVDWAEAVVLCLSEEFNRNPFAMKCEPSASLRRNLWHRLRLKLQDRFGSMRVGRGLEFRTVRDPLRMQAASTCKASSGRL